jgi:hypothetical protein
MDSQLELPYIHSSNIYKKSKKMSLSEEIQDKKSKIQSDAYSMALGELIHLYENSRLGLHPKSQRFFRWNDAQKSALIESILLGIPLPPIFVAQRNDGIWEVIDGLQRLSTVFELVGILRDDKGNKRDPLTLLATKYLPSLQDKRWDDPENPINELDPRQKFEIERTKIDVKIIREEDELNKYEIFLRLNTGGTPLSPQEVRNCILLMENQDMYDRLDALRKNENFQNCISFSESALSEGFDMELALRFVILRTMKIEDLQAIRDLTSFLNDRMLELARNRDFNWDGEQQAFRRTFEILAEGPQDNSFKRFSPEKDRFEGGFLNAAFEAVALGIGFHHENLYRLAQRNGFIESLENIIKKMWKDEENRKSLQSAGLPAASRIPKSVILGRDFFGELLNEIH